MKKNFSSNVKISVNLLKENFDDQYEECISTLGNSEIQINIGPRFTDIAQQQIFQKREKLVHSPESKDQPQSQTSAQETFVQEPENFKSKISNLLEQTEHIVFKYDQVFNSFNGDSENIETISKDHYDRLSKNSKNIMFFSFFKSNIINNYSTEDSQLRKDVETSNWKSIGLFSSFILRYLNDKNTQIEDESQGIKIRIFSAYAQKFYDLSGVDVRNYDSFKDVSKQKIIKQDDLVYYLMNARNNILFKKQYHFNFVGYDIELKNGQNQKSKISYIEFFNPIERNIEKIEKEKPSKNLESSLDAFTNSLKLLYTIFTNSKFEQSLNEKDKILDLLKSNWKFNTEFHFHANLRPVYPFYSQDLLTLQYLNKIHEKKEIFDTMFINMLFQIMGNSDFKKETKVVKEPNLKPQTIQTEDTSQLEELIKKNNLKNEENAKLLKENLNLSKALVDIKNQKSKLEGEFEFLKKNTGVYIDKIKAQHESEIAQLNQKLLNWKKTTEKEYKPSFTFSRLPNQIYVPDTGRIEKIEKAEKAEKIEIIEKIEKIEKFDKIERIEKSLNDVPIKVAKELSEKETLIFKHLTKLVSMGFFDFMEHNLGQNIKRMDLANTLNAQKCDLLHKRSKILEGQNLFLRNALNLLIERQSALNQLKK